MAAIKQLFFLLRLSQWPKAAFVFLGVFYSGSLAYLPKALMAAFAFCLIASAVYIYNDIQDKEEDKLHPHKCYRPLACGQISLSIALSLLIILLISGLALAWLVSSKLIAILGLYLLINLAYNHLLRNFAVIDVLCIASGFLLRVLAGTVGIGLSISYWLLFSATLVSLLIALCKRRLEKQLTIKYAARLVLSKYSLPVLDLMIITTAVGCFLTYFLYIIYTHDQSFYFFLTLPFAVFGLGRFVWITTSENYYDDPIFLVASDNVSKFNLLCFLLLTCIAIFFENATVFN